MAAIACSTATIADATETIYWKVLRDRYSPLMDRRVHCQHDHDSSSSSRSDINVAAAAAMENDNFARQALPIFLYNSENIGHNGRFALNLFEPRYRYMCECICNGKLPPFMLFVPNFTDYVPRPADFAKLCFVECRPSTNGQYSMFGQEVCYRTLELTWVEPASGGLWFATSIWIHQQNKNLWEGTIHQTFRETLVRRKKWDFRLRGAQYTLLRLSSGPSESKLIPSLVYAFHVPNCLNLFKSCIVDGEESVLIAFASIVQPPPSRPISQ